MSKSPLVSIIVVSYNHSRFIRENLDSIKAQTYPNIELIVADDASQDNSVEVFEKWLAENNFTAKKNFHTNNTGLATVLNECVEMVTGQYVKMIAADDYLHPQSIEKCVEKLEKLGEDYGMVFSDVITIDEEGRLAKGLFQYNNSSFFENIDTLKKTQLLDYNCIIAPTVLVHSHVLRQTGPYKKGFILEDHDRWLRINQIKKIGFIPEKLCYYRIVSSSVTKTQKDKMILADLWLKMEYDSTGLKKKEINEYFYNLYYSGKWPSKEMREKYYSYKHHLKHLKYCFILRIPPALMKKISSFL